MQPAYPATALKDSERGAAVIGVNVSEAGTVNYVYPLQTSGFADLDSAAIAAVLGWRFTPAMNGATKTNGNTAVELVFQPPDDQAAKTAPAAPPKPAGDFLPTSFQLEAKRDDYDSRDEPALCPNGTVKTTLAFLHALGPAASKSKPSAELGVGVTDNEFVAIVMGDAENFSPPAEMFGMADAHGGQPAATVFFSHMAPFGTPQTVQLSWDSAGLVTALVGDETHQTKLSAPPTKLLFSMFGGAAIFTNSILICKQANSG